MPDLPVSAFLAMALQTYITTPSFHSLVPHFYFSLICCPATSSVGEVDTEVWELEFYRGLYSAVEATLHRALNVSYFLEHSICSFLRADCPVACLADTGMSVPGRYVVPVVCLAPEGWQTRRQ